MTPKPEEARVPLSIETSRKASLYLDQLVATGLYGQTREQAAEELLRMTLDNLIGSGRLKPLP